MFKFKKNAKKDIISIEVGSYYLKLVLGRFTEGFFHIEKMIKVPMEHGVYENGVINDEDSFQAVLESGVKQLNTDVKDVIISLESSEVLKREIQVPKVEDADLQGLIRYEVSQYLPIDLDEYVIQYQVISSELVEDNERLNVLIVVMPRTMANYYFKILKYANLNPLAMELSGNNVIKLIKQSSEQLLLGNTVAIVDIGHASVDVIIMENGVHKLSRFIKVGFADLIERVVDDYPGLSREEVENMIKKYQDMGLKQLLSVADTYRDLLRSGESGQGDDKISAEELSESAAERIAIIEHLIEQTDLVIDELGKIFNYFTFKEHGRSLDRIILIGGQARYKDFDWRIADRLGVETIILDKSKLKDIYCYSSSEEINFYISAIGGLIR